MNPLLIDGQRWLTRFATDVWLRVRISLKRRGVFGTAGYALVAGLAKVALKLGLLHPSTKPSVARVFDGEHGVDTAGNIELALLEIKSQSVPDGNRYAPTSPKYFKEIMTHLGIRHEQFAFVDLGCGKGLALLLAAAYPFRRIIGVEFSAELATIAKRNITAYVGEGLKCSNVQCVCMDAVEYEFPREPLVIYLYNPFIGRVLAHVAANIARTIADHPRDVFIVYNWPTEPHVFDAIPSVECVVGDPEYMIYRTRWRPADRVHSLGYQETTAASK